MPKSIINLAIERNILINRSTQPHMYYRFVRSTRAFHFLARFLLRVHFLPVAMARGIESLAVVTVVKWEISSERRAERDSGRGSRDVDAAVGKLIKRHDAVGKISSRARSHRNNACDGKVGTREGKRKGCWRREKEKSLD